MKRYLLVALTVLVSGCLPVPTFPNLPSPPATWVLTVETEPGATMTTDGADPVSIFVGDTGSVSVPKTRASFNACARKDGYTPDAACVPITESRTQTVRIVLTPIPLPPPPPPPPVPSWPPALARSALPAFPSLTDVQPSGRYAGAWSAGPYDTVTPFPVPDKPDIDFHRGNVIGMRATSCNLPTLASGTAADPSLVITWDLPQYTPEQQTCILKEYHDIRGYTHFLISIPQARNWNVLDQRFLDAAKRIHDAGMFVVVVALGGDGETWSADVLPWMEKLVALHAVDEINIAWQADFRYTPAELNRRTIEISEWAHPRGIKISLHWVNEALAWWNAEDDPRDDNTCRNGVGPDREKMCNRFDYHRIMARWVDYQYLQVDVDAPINHPTNGGIQGSIGDVLRSFTTEKLVIAEYDMQAEFDHPATRLEEFGDLKGYLLMATRRNDKFVLGGYMNGSRRPDGRVH